MPRPKKDQKPFREEEKQEMRPKREASKNVQKLVDSIVKNEDIIPSIPLANRKKQTFGFQTNFQTATISSLLTKEENILNKMNLDKLLKEKMERYNILFDNDTSKFLNYNLSVYLKSIIAKLISITRIRNVNFNLFSRNQNGNVIPSYKIHTFNLDPVPQDQKLNFIPNKDFQILFTKNLKNDFNLIEEYHELNSKKIKMERLALYKTKLEEIAKEKGGQANFELTSGPNPIKLGPGRRTRKKDSAIIKTMRNNFVKSQKKEDFDRQKSFTMNTLDTFLDNKNQSNPSRSLGGTVSHMKFDVEMSSNKNESHFETFTKVSEISKSENNPNYLINDNNNEVNINIYQNYDVTQSERIIGGSKRKISLKDFIFFLENEMELPLKFLLLQKAMMKISQFGLTSH